MFSKKWNTSEQPRPCLLSRNLWKVNGQKYLDGGIADSIPFEKAQELGCDKIIVILTQPIDYRKTKSSSFLFKLFYRKYPHLVKTLENRYRTYNEQVEEIIRLEKQNKIFVIRPNVPLNIGRLERDETKIRTVYELGEKNSLSTNSRSKKILKKLILNKLFIKFGICFTFFCQGKNFLLILYQYRYNLAKFR